MSDPTNGQSSSPAHIPAVVDDLDAVRSILQVQQEQQALAAEAEKARAVRAQMCAYLLDSGLAASKLPAPMQDHVRQQFTGRLFEPAELQTAIDSARKLVSDLTAQVVDARDKPGHDVESFPFSAHPGLRLWAPARRNERILF